MAVGILQKLDYAYRLSVARLVIQRMRVARSIRQWLHQAPKQIPTPHAPPPGTGPARASAHGYLYVLIIAGLAGSVMAGYVMGFTKSRSLLSRATAADAGLMSPGSKLTGSVSSELQSGEALESDRQHVSVSAVHGAESLQVSALPDQGVPTDSQGAEQRSSEEIDTLRETVSRLTSEVQALQEEARLLESELLEQAVEFAEAEQLWKQQGVEHRVVYNITNLPVGGFVTDAQILADRASAEADTRIDQPEANSVASAYPAVPYDTGRDTSGATEQGQDEFNLAEVLAQGADSESADGVIQSVTATGEPGINEPGQADDQSAELQTFFGPAPDRYEDRISPQFAETPYEFQNRAEGVPTLDQ
ncbi:MAG: hypothetical protein HKN42_19770 [Granulosicoccus sp.]|nr:hypothetical protein [Granulosicoccus sp.]